MPSAMRTTVVQSVEISTLKTSADLPIQIRNQKIDERPSRSAEECDRIT